MYFEQQLFLKQLSFLSNSLISRACVWVDTSSQRVSDCRKICGLSVCAIWSITTITSRLTFSGWCVDWQVSWSLSPWFKPISFTFPNFECRVSHTTAPLDQRCLFKGQSGVPGLEPWSSEQQPKTLTAWVSTGQTLNFLGFYLVASGYYYIA